MKKCFASLTALSLFAGICALPAADEKPKPTPEETFKKLDKNADGKLTFEEFKGKRDEAKARPQFDAKDKDKDGSLTLEEFKAMPKKKKAS